MNSDGSAFLSENSFVRLSLNSKIIGYGILNNELHHLLLSRTPFTNFYFESDSSKRSLFDENLSPMKQTFGSHIEGWNSKVGKK